MRLATESGPDTRAAQRSAPTNVATAPASSAATIVGRINAGVLPDWLPAARRGFLGMAARLPAGLRYRLHRALGIMRPEMGWIERDYPNWIKRYDCIDADRRRDIAAQTARLRNPPVISVVMPVFNPSPEHLLTAVNSVRDQLYPWWQLCIGDDASTNPVVTAILRDAAERDDRIKLVRRERNGHISAASNSALRLATGQFVALLDHDDVLPAHALHEVAMRIVAQPNVDIIYSDEDHIDDEGRRSHPYFKPDWDPNLMLGHNVISHLGVYRRSLVEHIGGFQTGYEGSQDYDLALRMVAETRPQRIAHIPRVLYHWRQGAAGPTFSEASQDVCVQNGRRAVSDYVQRVYPGARVEPAPLLPAWTRVVYPVPEPAPLVSLIVSGVPTPDSLAAWADRLLALTDYPAIEVLVSASELGKGTLPDPLDPDGRVRIVAGGYLEAVAQAAGSLLLMLDSRLIPDNAGWLREMVSHAVRPEVGAVGAKLLCRDGTVSHAGLAVGGPGLVFTPFAGRRNRHSGYFGHLQLVRDVTAVTGACMMLRRESLVAVGGRDKDLAGVFGDVDLCLKLAEIGLRTVWTPYAELMFESEAAQPVQPAIDTTRSPVRLRQRWGSRLQTDRYWNRNLSLDPTRVGLAFPPRPEAGVSEERPSEAHPVVLAS